MEAQQVSGSAMRRKQSLPVRFTLEQEDAIAQIADANGISRAEVVRLAVIQFLTELNQNGKLTVAHVIKAPGVAKAGSGGAEKGTGSRVGKR